MICMKKISTISEKRTSLTVYMMIIAAGIGIGAFLAKYSSLADNHFVNQFFLVSQNDTEVAALIAGNFLISSLVVTAAFLFGASAVGQPFGVLLLIYRGIGIGISSSAMYLSAGTKAILPVAVIVIPVAIAFSAVAALAVRENVHNSCMIFSCCFGRSINDGARLSLKLILIKYIVLVILSLIISFADGGLCFLYNSVGGK